MLNGLSGRVEPFGEFAGGTSRAGLARKSSAASAMPTPFDAEVVRRKRTGDLDLLNGGRESLAEFAEEWWKLYAAPKPRVADSA